MIRKRHSRSLMCQGPESFRKQDIVYSQQRPHMGIGRTESMTDLTEGILSVSGHSEIRIRHRIIIEVSADKGLDRALFNVGEHLVYLLRTSCDGAFHLRSRITDNSLVSTQEASEDTGKGDIVTLEVAVIHPEPSSMKFIVCEYGKVRAFVKLDLALVLYGYTAQCHIAEGRTVGHREKVEISLVALQLSAEI